jgi:hypothetical protein
MVRLLEPQAALIGASVCAPIALLCAAGKHRGWRGAATSAAAAAAKASAAARSQRQQPIDVLAAACRELRSGRVLIGGGVAVASLRCCLADGPAPGGDENGSVRMRAVCCLADGRCVTVYPPPPSREPQQQERGGQGSSSGSRAASGSSMGEQARSLDLLARALAWLRCDVYGDCDAMLPLMSADASMFGACGAAEVLAFKRRWLSQPLNYNVDVVHEIDVQNRTVVVGFTSLIRGGEGRGTDVIQFDVDLKVSGVDAIRHANVGQKKQPSAAPRQAGATKLGADS